MTEEQRQRRADKLRKEFKDAAEEHRRCHCCDKLFDLEDIAFLRGCCLQGATGRIFCHPTCWEAYKEEEGL